MAPLIPIAISLAAKYIPEIIEHFSGKNAAGVASKVLEVAQQVTGSATPDEAVKALAANPELALQFKKAVLDQEVELKRISLEEVKVFLADADSARKREAEIVTSDKAPMLNKLVTPILALGTVALTFLMFGLMIYMADGDLKPAQERIIIFIAGAMVPLCVQVYSYYFGSSKGDAAKDQHIRDFMNNGH